MNLTFYFTIQTIPTKAPRPIVKKIQQPPTQQSNLQTPVVSSNRSQEPEPIKSSTVQIPAEMISTTSAPIVTKETKIQEHAPQERLSMAETVEEVDDIAWKEEVEEHEDAWNDEESNPYAQAAVANLETVTEENGSGVTAVALYAYTYYMYILVMLWS